MLRYELSAQYIPLNFEFDHESYGDDLTMHDLYMYTYMNYLCVMRDIDGTFSVPLVPIKVMRLKEHADNAEHIVIKNILHAIEETING